MSNHWSSLSLPCMPPRPQSSQTFFLKPESLSLTPSRVSDWNRPTGQNRVLLNRDRVSCSQCLPTRSYWAWRPSSCQISCQWLLGAMLEFVMCTWMCVCVCGGGVYDPGNTVTVLSCRLRAMEVYTDRHTERLSLSLDLNLHPRSKSWLENPIFFFISIHNIFISGVYLGCHIFTGRNKSPLLRQTGWTTSRAH